MRKAITLSLSLIMIFGLLAQSQAAPSNGTRLPPGRSVELGYEFNMMFKRILDRSYGNLSSHNHFYTVSFGAFDWLSLDGKIGVGDVTQDSSSLLPKLEYNTGFAGGYGFRIKAFHYKPWRLRMIWGFQHISVHPAVRSAGDDKYNSFLDDWQVSGLLAEDFKSLTVYAGIKGSDCEIVYKINKHDKKRRFSNNHVGLLTGVEAYLFKDKARVAAEGRFFDETALSASISCLF